MLSEIEELKQLTKLATLQPAMDMGARIRDGEKFTDQELLAVWLEEQLGFWAKRKLEEIDNANAKV